MFNRNTQLHIEYDGGDFFNVMKLDVLECYL